MLRAFIVRDFLLEKNYKLAFFLKLTGMYLYLLIFYFMSLWLDQRSLSFGADFFAKILIGVVFANLLLVPLNCFPESIRREQLFGTLETLYLAPAGPLKSLLFSLGYPFLTGLIETSFYLVIIVFLPGGQFFLPAFVLLGLLFGLLAMAAIGLLSASFILAFKRGDPVSFLMNAGMTLLGGVFFPVKVLPKSLLWLAYLNPVTHALELIRFGFGLGRQSPWSLQESFLYLVIFSCLLIPLGIIAFQKAVTYSKQTGSLGKY